MRGEKEGPAVSEETELGDRNAAWVYVRLKIQIKNLQQSPHGLLAFL